jgi:hypothetical protein
MHLKDDELIAALSGHADVPVLLAATYARVTTAVSFTRMLTPLGNYFIARPAARAAAHHITEETDVPLDAAVVLGLSSDALHIWSADPMLDQVGEYLGHVPLERITAIQATPGRSWQELTLTLDGGHEIELEARGASHALAAAYDKLSAAPS